MMNTVDEAISLSAPIFEGLRIEADAVIQTMLRNMDENCLSDGETVIKIKAHRQEDTAPDLMSQDPDAKRKIIVPSFAYQVTTIMKQEHRNTGSVGGNYELVWDSLTGKYIRRRVLEAQTSIFDPPEPMDIVPA